MITQDIWFLKSPRGGMIYGPYSLEQLQQAVQLGKLQGNFLASRDSSLWRTLNDVMTIAATKKLSVPDAFLDPTIAKKSATEAFENYEILDEIGRGGMGIVYKARDKRVQRIVALKVLLTSEDHRQLLRFLRERELTAQLQHPYIVALLDVGEHPKPFLTMEFVDGIPLTAVIKENVLATRQATELFVKICAGIEHAHRQKIVHRDIKPANILIDKKGDPKITDFGIARNVESKRDISYSGEILGTPKYMSPEQVAGREVDYRADIYSLGAVFYEMLVGRPPFEGNSVFNILSQLANQEPITPRALNPDIPVDLEMICLTCLQKFPQKRYRTAGLLKHDLENFLENRPISVRAPNAVERTKKWIVRNKIATALIVCSMLAAFLLFAWGIREQQWAKSKQELTTKTLTECGYLYASGCSELYRKNFSCPNRNCKHDKPPYQKCAYGEFDRAIQLLTQAGFDKKNLADSSANLSSYYWLRGHIALILKDYPKARENLTMVLKLGSLKERESAKIHLLMALCEADEKKWKEARECWKTARALWQATLSVQEASENWMQYFAKYKAPVDEMIPLPFSTPLPHAEITQDEARYYALSHLLPEEFKLDVEEQLFTKPHLNPTNLPKTEGKRYKKHQYEDLLTEEIHTMEYLLFDQREKWIEEFIEHKDIRFSELKEMLIYTNKKWILDMSSPYWLHLKIEDQNKYATMYQEAYARQEGLKEPLYTFQIGETKFPMNLIPPGQFVLGVPNAHNEEGPGTLVCLPDHYWMGQTEVTQRQWNEVLKDKENNSWSKPELWSKPDLANFYDPEKPVVFLDLKLLKEFCSYLNKNVRIPMSHGKFELPDECQWEYACRAGTTALCYWDQDPILKSDQNHDRFLWHCKNARTSSDDFPVFQRVALKLKNAWNQYDMLGNVGELCQNTYFLYTNPIEKRIFFSLAGSREGIGVYRGGHFGCPLYHCFSSIRRSVRVEQISENKLLPLPTFIGFRFTFIPMK